MFKGTIVAADQRFDIEVSSGTFLVSEQPVDIDIRRISANSFHLLFGSRSFVAELIELDTAEKTCRIRINDSTYTLQVNDPFQALLARMGISATASQKVKELKAPMPGLVLSIAVSEGDALEKDDHLMTLEAMKMENIIKSPGEAVVTAILVKLGDKVEKNQVLMRF